MDLVMVFAAQFGQIFALVMNSKLLRDDRWILAMTNSWVISITNFIFIYAVANTQEPLATFLAAALGGSLGCGASHHFYTKWIYKKGTNPCNKELCSTPGTGEPLATPSSSAASSTNTATTRCT